MLITYVNDKISATLGENLSFEICDGDDLKQPVHNSTVSVFTVNSLRSKRSNKTKQKHKLIRAFVTNTCYTTSIV